MDEPAAPPSLPSYTEEVLETVTPWLASAEGGLPRAEIATRLKADGFEPATIKAALDQLIDRGYLYDVNGTLRVTATQP